MTQFPIAILILGVGGAALLWLWIKMDKWCREQFEDAETHKNAVRNKED